MSTKTPPPPTTTTTSTAVASVREATPDDVPSIIELIRLLAVYENAEEQVKMTADVFLKDGFQEPKRFHCLVATADDGSVVGYALFFFIYSTWEGLSLYLEDLFVRKENRGQGLGLGLVRAVVNVAQDKDCARVQWQCIDWNTKALEFYKGRMFARERIEDNDAKWLNMIMDRDAQAKFISSF